jgi:hypothetical protein
MPTLHAHSITLLLIAFKAAKRAFDHANHPEALSDDTLPAILMSVTAAEAFINELAEFLNVASRVRTPSLETCAELLREIEEYQGQVTLKYHVAALALRGQIFDAGAQPFQDFAQLVKLRNAIVHLKPGGNGRKIADALAQRGLALSDEATKGLPWLDRLLAPQTAKWAVQTARNMMLAVLAMANEHFRNQEFNELIMFNLGLRNNPVFDSLVQEGRT